MTETTHRRKIKVSLGGGHKDIMPWGLPVLLRWGCSWAPRSGAVDKYGPLATYLLISRQISNPISDKNNVLASSIKFSGRDLVQ